MLPQVNNTRRGMDRSSSAISLGFGGSSSSFFSKQPIRMVQDFAPSTEYSNGNGDNRNNNSSIAVGTSIGGEYSQSPLIAGSQLTTRLPSSLSKSHSLSSLPSATAFRYACPYLSLCIQAHTYDMIHILPFSTYSGTRDVGRYKNQWHGG